MLKLCNHTLTFARIWGLNSHCLYQETQAKKLKKLPQGTWKTPTNIPCIATSMQAPQDSGRLNSADCEHAVENALNEQQPAPKPQSV